ncbi:hypothetical protein BCR44DRAFT_34637 [Catenaria anguillulae PL171]|uniref:Translation machinery-associated protein 20 n=1 Tax=Catenaria anguillulae PL171 TaxID=765915 RepID=A0A1Y2HHH5_9FUNG|nr:hypothetical protein BCR44DRAFT_34637 [Catenaria anguillulae PL171]
MFKKFDTKESITGQTQAKSSVQKSIRAKIVEAYPKIEPYMDEIIPKKSPLVIVKCQDRIQLLCIDNVPLFFNHFDGQWMPTLRLLHKYPFMMPYLQVDRGAIKFILSSAHIMCPGLTSAGAWMPPAGEGLPTETPVAIFAEGKTLPLAIGVLKMSTDEIRKINKNVGVETMHHLNDGLWKTLSLH